MMRFLFIVLLTLQGVAMAGMRHGTAVALNGEPVAQLTRYEHEFPPPHECGEAAAGCGGAAPCGTRQAPARRTLATGGGGYGTEYLEPHAKAFSVSGDTEPVVNWLFDESSLDGKFKASEMIARWQDKGLDNTHRQ